MTQHSAPIPNGVIINSEMFCQRCGLGMLNFIKRWGLLKTNNVLDNGHPELNIFYIYANMAYMGKLIDRYCSLCEFLILTNDFIGIALRPYTCFIDSSKNHPKELEKKSTVVRAFNHEHALHIGCEELLKIKLEERFLYNEAGMYKHRITGVNGEGSFNILKDGVVQATLVVHHGKK